MGNLGGSEPQFFGWVPTPPWFHRSFANLRRRACVAEMANHTWSWDRVDVTPFQESCLPNWQNHTQSASPRNLLIVWQGMFFEYGGGVLLVWQAAGSHGDGNLLELAWNNVLCTSLLWGWVDNGSVTNLCTWENPSIPSTFTKQSVQTHDRFAKNRRN